MSDPRSPLYPDDDEGLNLNLDFESASSGGEAAAAYLEMAKEKKSSDSLNAELAAKQCGSAIQTAWHEFKKTIAARRAQCEQARSTIALQKQNLLPQFEKRNKKIAAKNFYDIDASLLAHQQTLDQYEKDYEAQLVQLYQETKPLIDLKDALGMTLLSYTTEQYNVLIAATKGKTPQIIEQEYARFNQQFDSQLTPEPGKKASFSSLVSDTDDVYNDLVKRQAQLEMLYAKTKFMVQNVNRYGAKSAEMLDKAKLASLEKQIKANIPETELMTRNPSSGQFVRTPKLDELKNLLRKQIQANQRITTELEKLTNAIVNDEKKLDTLVNELPAAVIRIAQIKAEKQQRREAELQRQQALLDEQNERIKQEQLRAEEIRRKDELAKEKIAAEKREREQREKMQQEEQRRQDELEQQRIAAAKQEREQFEKMQEAKAEETQIKAEITAFRGVLKSLQELSKQVSDKNGIIIPQALQAKDDAQSYLDQAEDQYELVYPMGAPKQSPSLAQLHLSADLKHSLPEDATLERKRNTTSVISTTLAASEKKDEIDIEHLLYGNKNKSPAEVKAEKENLIALVEKLKETTAPALQDIANWATHREGFKDIQEDNPKKYKPSPTLSMVELNHQLKAFNTLRSTLRGEKEAKTPALTARSARFVNPEFRLYAAIELAIRSNLTPLNIVKMNEQLNVARQLVALSPKAKLGKLINIKNPANLDEAYAIWITLDADKRSKHKENKEGVLVTQPSVLDNRLEHIKSNYAKLVAHYNFKEDKDKNAELQTQVENLIKSADAAQKTVAVPNAPAKEELEMAFEKYLQLENCKEMLCALLQDIALKTYQDNLLKFDQFNTVFRGIAVYGNPLELVSLAKLKEESPTDILNKLKKTLEALPQFKPAIYAAIYGQPGVKLLQNHLLQQSASGKIAIPSKLPELNWNDDTTRTISKIKNFKDIRRLPDYPGIIEELEKSYSALTHKIPAKLNQGRILLELIQQILIKNAAVLKGHSTYTNALNAIQQGPKDKNPGKLIEPYLGKSCLDMLANVHAALNKKIVKHAGFFDTQTVKERRDIDVINLENLKKLEPHYQIYGAIDASLREIFVDKDKITDEKIAAATLKLHEALQVIGLEKKSEAVSSVQNSMQGPGS